MPSWNLDSVEEAFAEAALDPTLWVKALESASIATQSFGALLIPMAGGALPTLPFTESITESFETYFREGWHLRDERMRGATAMIQRGVVTDLDLFDAETITRHPYYQEFLAPHRLRWFAGINMSCSNESWCLSIQRTIDQEPFSASEKAELALLSTRLSASVATARAFGAAAADGALEAFDVSGTAVVLINRYGRIFLANQSALQLLVGDVQIKQGRLEVKDERAQALLNAAINDLLRRQAGGLSAPIALPRTGRNPLLAYPVRPARIAANALADCQAMIMLIDPDTVRTPPEETLRRVFRLTKAEARLGSQLALGESLETVSERLGISKETSRSQLKSIFAKTRINRQSALVAMLSALL